MTRSSHLRAARSVACLVLAGALIEACGGETASAPASGSQGGSQDASSHVAQDAGGVDVTTACIGTTNTLVITGDTDFHRGAPLVLTGGYWTASVEEVVDGLPSYVSFDVQVGWMLEFSSTLLGKPLLPGTYPDAQWFPFPQAKHPGLHVSAHARDCGGLTGQFTVVEMKSKLIDAGDLLPLKSFTAYFELHCDSDPLANYGCVHYQP